MNKSQALTEARSDYEKFINDHLKTVDILQALPPELDFKMLHLSAYKGDGTILIEVKKRIEVLPYLRLLQPVPAIHFSGISEQGVLPAHLEPPTQNYKSCCPWVVINRVATTTQKTTEVRWWTYLVTAEKLRLLEVHVRVLNDPAWFFREPKKATESSREYLARMQGSWQNVAPGAQQMRYSIPNGVHTLFWWDNPNQDPTAVFVE